jgi:DNA-directed RNA polymerase II subunit RPB2
MKSSDMMFSASGITPDIILNPNAIPSRMTIGQLIECLLGKVSALDGLEGDGTPFNDINIEDIKDRLARHGYHRDGIEYMYNGMTGQRLKHQIYIGPTFYNRLKHLVEDKLHSRSRGPRTILTRQPPEGRSREGGLRMGEMERDALIAHGIAKFMKEKLLDTSDAYSTYICDKCGLFAQRLYRKESKRFIANNDIFYCAACKNYTEISKIMIPYACKLLFQELMALNIAPRIRTKKSVYD